MEEKEMIDELFDESEEPSDTPEDTADEDTGDEDTDEGEVENEEESTDEGNADEDGEPEPEEEADPEPPKKEEPAPATEAPKKEEDSPELLAERAKSAKSEADLRRLLNALGYDDVDSYLADQEGISKAEYLERTHDAELLAKAKAEEKRQLDADAAKERNAKYAKMAAEDLAALKSAGLIDSSVKGIHELTNVRRFAELREKGLSAVEAYRAAAGATIDARIEQKVQRTADTKAHLVPPKSRGTSSHGTTLSPREKAYYRELLGTDDDRAIERAWKRATGRG